MSRLNRTLIALVLASGGVVVRAQQVDTARIALDSAEKRLTGATGDAIAARRELDYALTNQRQAADMARGTASSIDQLRLTLDDPGAVDRALASARESAKVVAERETALQQARGRLDMVSGTVEERRTAMQREFDASPMLADARGRVDTAQVNVELTVDWSLLLLENDADYRQLEMAAETYRVRADYLRTMGGPDAQALARASQQWMNLENERSRWEQDWLSEDPQVIRARAGLQQARQTLDGLNRRFEADMSGDARMTELIAIRDAEQKRVASVTAELNEARMREQASRADAQAMQMRLAAARDEYARLQSELSTAYNDLDSAAASVNSSDRRFRDILDAQDRAAIERDRALRDFRRSQDDSSRLRDERDRLVRIDRDNTTSRDAAEDRDRDRALRNQDSTVGTPAKPLEIPARVPPPQSIGSAPDPIRQPSREPNREPIVTPTPRADRPDRTLESQQNRIDDTVRRASDSGSTGSPRSITDDVRDRSPGTYRPTGGSDR